MSALALCRLRFLPWNWYKFHKAVSKLDNTLMPHIKSRLLAHDKKSAENEATQEQDKGTCDSQSCTLRCKQHIRWHCCMHHTY